MLNRRVLVSLLLNFVIVGAFWPCPAWCQVRGFFYQKVVTPATPGATDFMNPTTLALAPDGRLFFAQQNGKIHYVTLNANFEVVGSVGRIDTIFNLGLGTAPQGRTVTGMTFEPTSGDLFVSHSDGRLGTQGIPPCPDPAPDPTATPNYSIHSGTCSGTVTRLLAPNFATAVHIVTGLPRSRTDHGPNGLAFNAGKLYLAQAGMTNAGTVGPGNWNVPAAPKSAAILEIDVNAPLSSPAVYATGLRNPYDLLWHSNGKLYANDNRPNLGAGNVIVGNGNCTDSGTSHSETPGEINWDELNLIEPTHYYGHPNARRGECDFDGAHTPPIHRYGLHVSSNGIAEYTSVVLPGLQHDIITANYAGGGGVGQSVVSVKLAASGFGIEGTTRTLRGPLENPLDVVVRADGAIFIAEYSVFNTVLSAISVLRVKQTAAIDFDGDRRSDLAVYRSSNGEWHWRYSAGGTYAHGPFGLPSDIPVPVDYDGDGRAEPVVWRSSTGTWHFRTSSSGWTDSLSVQLGTTGDKPVPADFDGDGRADFAVYRPSTGQWHVRYTGTGNTTVHGQFGLPSDIPFPMDYDGDGRADLVVWRPSLGEWHVRTSSSGWTDAQFFQWGLSTDIPVPADFDGDGRTDFAMYRPLAGEWHIRHSSTGSGMALGPFGLANDIPRVIDYDGDGRADLAVWRPTTGEWHIRTSSSSWTTSQAVGWGAVGDVPLGRSF